MYMVFLALFPGSSRVWKAGRGEPGNEAMVFPWQFLSINYTTQQVGSW